MKASVSTKRSSWTALVLTGGGWPGDYDIVRSLGHTGVRSAVASSDPSSIAFHSKFVERHIVLPAFERQNESEILRQLLDIGTQQSVRPILYYVGDSELLFVSQYAGVLSAVYRFLLPDEGLLDSITNKARFQDLARTYQLPVPRTIVVRSYDELGRRAKDIDYPCIVKPPYNRDWFWRSPLQTRGYKDSLRRFNSQEELMEFCRRIPAWDSGILVQSYIEGGENQTISFLGYFDEHSRCLGSFVGRESRTSPPITGNPTFSEIIENKDLQLFSITTLQRLGMKGIVKIDYVWDERYDHFRMLEIEPHYQAWHLLGSYVGNNLAMVAYHHQRGEPVEERNYVQRGSMLYFRPDLSEYIRVYRKSGYWPFRKYLRSLLECDCYRVLDPRDLRPFMVSLLYFSRKLIKRLLSFRPWAEIVTR